ncbi:MAG TPA: diaminopimelate epimerase [Terracidiphilus sp.]|nr:diaminopimelate epimerase [Terracidiphilus sp.]
MIPFAKAHACGNDFLIVAEDDVTGRDLPGLTRSLCDRNRGVGADGIEFFTWTRRDRTGPAARVRLFNADGSTAEISGNGTRCVAAWMAEALHAQPGQKLDIVTDAGLRVCLVNAVHNGNQFSVDVTTGMGIPAIAQKTVTLADGASISGSAVSIGNPHFVVLVDNPGFTVAGRAWQAVGTEICAHPAFPHQTNVEFVLVTGDAGIEIRIFERGVGPTHSSGTGTSAAATAALALGLATSPLRVVAPGGPQTVAWAGPGAELQLTGPASLIARGEAWLP